MAVADRCTVLRKGKYMGTVDIEDTTKEELSRHDGGPRRAASGGKRPAEPGEVVLDVEDVTVHNDHKNNAVKDVSFRSARARSSASPVSTATARRSSSTA